MSEVSRNSGSAAESVRSVMKGFKVVWRCLKAHKMVRMMFMMFTEVQGCVLGMWESVPEHQAWGGPINIALPRGQVNVIYLWCDIPRILCDDWQMKMLRAMIPLRMLSQDNSNFSKARSTATELYHVYICISANSCANESKEYFKAIISEQNDVEFAGRIVDLDLGNTKVDVFDHQHDINVGFGRHKLCACWVVMVKVQHEMHGCTQMYQVFIQIEINTDIGSYQMMGKLAIQMMHFMSPCKAWTRALRCQW